MPSIIQIKRSANVAAPTTSDLELGELAYSYDKSNDGIGAKLYIEAENNSGAQVIHTIGGKYYTDIVDAATDANTANRLVKRDGSGNFSAGIITANLYGNANTATRLATTRYINLSGDATGTAAFDGTGNADITVTVTNNSVALGTDTTGDYVSNVLAGTGIVVSGQGGETATPTITLAASGVTPTTYGGTSSVPVITVDTYGRITSASNTTISTSFNIAGGAGSDTVNGGETLTFTGNTGITTAVGNNVLYITNSGVTSLTGTANEVEVSAASGAVTVGLPDNVTIGNNLTVTGDLIVNGTAVTMNTATVTVEDPLVRFGNANPADTLDIGFFGEYTSSGQKFAGLFRDASDSGKFKLFVDLTSDPTTNVINTANYTVATLVSNLTGGTVSGLTANINVADGGTGRGTLTTNAVLYGLGTSAVGLATGTAGQILQLNNSGVPVFAALDGGSY